MSPFDPSVQGLDPREASDPRPLERGWVVDKRIPLAMILNLTLQILVAGLWFGRTEARLDRLDAWVGQNQATDRRLAVIESRLDVVHESLDKIERHLSVGE